MFFPVVIAISSSRFPKQFNRSVFIMDTECVFCEAGNHCFVCDADIVDVHRVKCVCAAGFQSFCQINVSKIL